MSLYQGGTGNPEGSVTAGVATLWAQTDGANAAVTWRKISGSGNTGWEELQGAVGVVRPEDYGAVGDDSTDDTVALQNAINAAISAKKRVLLRKQYKITATLNVAGSVIIEGNGFSSVVRQAFVRGPSPNNNAPNVLTVSGADVIVRNLRIRGDNGTTGSDIGKNHGIYVDGAKRLRVVDCWVHEAESAGIRVCNANDVLIHGCFFFDNAPWRPNPAPNFSYDSCDIGLSTGSCVNRRVTIANNHCLSNNSQGIYVNATNNDTEVKVIGNTCVALDPSGNEVDAASNMRRHGILVTYAGGMNGGRIVVANNICRNTRWTGIYYVASTNPSCPVLICGNFVSHTGVIFQENPPASAQGGIMLNSEGDGIIVANNIVDDIAIGPGIGLASHLGTPKGQTLIANNVLRNCQSDAGAGVYVEGRPQNVLITGNLFVDNLGHDVIVSTAPPPPANFPGDVVISNNYFRKTANPPQYVGMDMVLVATETSTRTVVIEGNYFRGIGMTWGSGVTYWTTNVVVKRNTFVDCPSGIEAQNGIPAGRYLEFPQIDYNVFRDCTYGIRVAGTTANATQILEGNLFLGTTTPLQDSARDGSTFKCGYIGRRSGTRLVAESSAAPGQGTWAVGDEVASTLPGPSGASRLICTGAGSPGTWTPVGFAQGVSGDRGDSSVTLTVGVDSPTQRFATNLTANRTVTLSTTNARNGDRFRIVRTGVGNKTLDVGPGLKTIPSATKAFVDVEYTGSAWVLAAYGAI